MPVSLERKCTYRQCEILVSSYIPSMSIFWLLFPNWMRISWRLLCFLFCWLKNVCSPSSQTCQFLDDAIYGIECIFFPERLNDAFSSEMGLLANCHSSMRHPVGEVSLWSDTSWVRSIVFWILFLLLSWFSSSFCCRTFSRCLLRKGAKEVQTFWKLACQKMSSFWLDSWQFGLLWNSGHNIFP